jgi:hypothetical protein
MRPGLFRAMLRWPVSAFRRSHLAALIVPSVATLFASQVVLAYDEPPLQTDRPVYDDPPVAEISRDGWRARIEEAKRRAKEIAIERRENPARFDPPPIEDLDQVATDRVLNDDSLQFGDIVSTKNGLFVFRGRSDRPRRPEDFVALPSR